MKIMYKEIVAYLTKAGQNKSVEHLSSTTTNK